MHWSNGYHWIGLGNLGSSPGLVWWGSGGGGVGGDGAAILLVTSSSNPGVMGMGCCKMRVELQGNK